MHSFIGEPDINILFIGKLISAQVKRSSFGALEVPVVSRLLPMGSSPLPVVQLAIPVIAHSYIFRAVVFRPLLDRLQLTTSLGMCEHPMPHMVVLFSQPSNSDPSSRNHRLFQLWPMTKEVELRLQLIKMEKLRLN